MFGNGTVVRLVESEAGDFYPVGTRVEVVGEARGRYGNQPWHEIVTEDGKGVDMVEGGAVRKDKPAK